MLKSTPLYGSLARSYDLSAATISRLGEWQYDVIRLTLESSVEAFMLTWFNKKRLGHERLEISDAIGITPTRARSGAVSAGAGILLDVPLVAQDKSNTCWYVAACMVAYYFAPGPRLGVPSVWAKGDTTGISPKEFVVLAKNEGLTNAPLLTYHANAQIMYPASILKQMLKDNGPLWCAGYWFGPGHIIVLTGVIDDTVFFNDPDGGVKKTGSLTWFNEKIARKVAGNMLCKVKGHL